MDMYWPPEKVLLYGVFALFPERLQDKDFAAAQQHSRLELTKENRSAILHDFLAYLAAFELDKLTTGTRLKPERFSLQQEKLLFAARRQFARDGYHPVLDLTDIWQAPEDQKSPLATFWELVFTEHFRTGYIRITNLGYDGTYAISGEEQPLPFVEFEVPIGSLFQRAIEPPKLVKARSVPATASVAQQQYTSLAMDKKGAVYATLPSGENRLIKKLRVDSPAYNFMGYLLGNQNKDIPRGDIATKVEGCGSKKNMTELVRDCGFTNELLPLKSSFFGGTTAQKVCFKAKATISQQEQDALTARELVIA